MKTVLRPIENNTASPMYVGNVMIPPGETKVVEMPVTRKMLAPAPAGPTAGEQLQAQIAELLDHPVKHVVAQLESLTHEALDLMEQMEQGGKTRRTLIDAIGAERIRRADEKLQADEAAKREQALAAARDTLLKARVAVDNLPPTATAAEREAADQAAAEAQAAVDALENPEG